jgi:hypothetical protein
MKKYNVLTQAAVAVALGSIAFGANAAGNLTAASVTTTYASQAVSTANGTVVVAANKLIYTSVSGLAAGAIITFTLPSGLTFANTPTVTASTAGTVASVTGGGAGSNSLTVGLSVTPLAANGTVSIGAFTVNGATALATAGNVLDFSAKASGDSTAANNDPDPVKTSKTNGSLVSANGLAFTSAPGVANPVIVDVGTTGGVASNGTLFQIAGTNQKNARVGQFTTAPAGGVVTADGTTAYGFPAGATISATVSGNFGAIASAYLDPALASTCPTTAPAGAITGTVTSSAITFPNLVPATAAAGYAVCLFANGTAIIQPTNPISASATVSGGVGTSQSGNLSAIAYNGTVLNYNYVVGNQGGYVNYLRVQNPTGGSARLIVSVRTDAGVVTSGTLDSGLPAGQAKLYTLSDVNTATGAGITTAGDRATISILSTAAITGSNLMVNPNSTVVTMP